MAILDVIRHRGASPDWIADAITQLRDGNTHPRTRGEDLKQIADKPKFVVLDCQKLQKGFESKDGNGYCDIYQLVLCDGSNCCIQARTFSQLSGRMAGDIPIAAGSLLTVKDHDLIWHGSNRLFHWRGVMLVKDYSIEPAPLTDESKVGEDPVFIKERFDFGSISSVLGKQRILFLNYVSGNTIADWDDDEDFSGWYWTEMQKKGIAEGHFIKNTDTRRQWKWFLGDRKRTLDQLEEDSDVYCSCQEKFGFDKCVNEAFPICRVTNETLFECAADRLGTSISGDSFDDLKPSHKRWCYYYYYAVNVFCGTFGGKHKDRKKLPICFVDYIRKIHPNPTGHVYTGHKDKGE